MVFIDHGSALKTRMAVCLLSIAAFSCNGGSDGFRTLNAASADQPPSSSNIPPEPPVSNGPLPPKDPNMEGELDPGCMSNVNYDTCIFYKNPVAQTGLAFNPAVSSTSDLSKVQIYGVKLKDLDGSGFLQNDNYSVSPGGQMERVTKNSQGSWKFPFSLDCNGSTCNEDSDHKVGQLMAYYWLNRQVEVMTGETGQFYAKGQNISVETYSDNLANAYWDGSSIVMGDGASTKPEFALAAEVYLHEAGHANLSFGATGSIGASDTCSSAKGCMGGINEGQADYHAAIMFPEGNVNLGETIMNSPDGLVECGLSRGIVANQNTTAQQAYDACSKKKGEVHLMGRVYASVWWQVRSKSTSLAKEVDQLFTEHLKALQSSDTFASALAKIKSVDKSLFASKYSADFTSEFARRGI